MIAELKEQYDKLSRGQKKVADYVIENADLAVFMTAQKLGETVGVSESTVVRFAMRMGCAGFPDFMQQVAEDLQSGLAGPDRSYTRRLQLNPSELMRKVLVRDAQNIVDSIHMVEEYTFDQAVELLQNAGHVYVLGIRSCLPLAQYFSYYLGLFRKDVQCLNGNNINELFEQLSWMEPGDTLVGISFPRYSLRTLKAMDFANSRGGRLLTITDNEYSPMNMYSSCNLWVRSDMITVLDSMVAPMSLINALIVAVYMRDQENANRHLGDMERMWEKYQVYERDELEKNEE